MKPDIPRPPVGQQWKPSPETIRYDRARVARLQPIRDALTSLGLPVLRCRKLLGILSAVEVQIEDAGDSPDVNHRILDALRAAVLFQVTETEARPALHAIDLFEEQENQRWELIRAGSPPPLELTPVEELDELMHEGYQLREKNQDVGASERWLEAWERVKALARPEMRTGKAFDDVYRPELMYFFVNWRFDLSETLSRTGLTDPRYWEYRVRFAREYLTLFPGEDVRTQVRLRRDEGEALIDLGRRAEAEALYTALVERFPDEGWAYIGWADGYWRWTGREPKQYERAEAILQRALARPGLKDRDHVLNRLNEMREERGGTRKKPPSQAPPQAGGVLSPPPGLLPPPAPPRQLGRNAPCWCGSGKKYKQCHLRQDQR
jgi:tetratricopeptide (TPR) repeat protein